MRLTIVILARTVDSLEQARSYLMRLTIIILARTVDSLEIYKVLHCSHYSSETNADRATKIMSKMQHARSYRMHFTTSL
jgi:hypothetical protein